jgi:hypothetical protein
VSNGGVTLVRFATAFVLLLPVVACKREAAATFGEPTGLQLSVDGTNVQVAVATSGGTSNGASVTSSVNTVASGFHGALKACPEAVAFLKKGQGFRIQFAVEQGKAAVAPQQIPKEAPVACVLKALHGKTLFVGSNDAAPAENFNLLAEVRQGP